MEKIDNSFRGIEYELSGAKDLRYPILFQLILFSVPIIGFVIMQISIMAWIFVSFAAFVICLCYVMWLLMYRKSCVKVDKTGISGQGRVGKGLNTHSVSFCFLWQDIKEIRFNSESLMDIENHIEFVVDGSVYVYTFPYRFSKHKDLFDAIRTFGSEDLLDNEAIRSLEKSDSWVSVVLKGIGFGAFLFVGMLFYFKMKGML